MSHFEKSFHLTEGNFPDCELIISCCNANGGLYHLLLQENKVVLKKLIHGDFRGVAKYKDLYIAASQNSVYLYDRDFQFLSHREFEGADYHGISVYHGMAYIVETGNNVIGVYKIPSLERTGQITFGQDGKDYNHMNDLFIHDESIYLSMFSGKTHWRNTSFQSGIILKYSLVKNKVQKLFSKLYQPHSVIASNENLYFCDSLAFEVKENGKTLFQSYGYLRGLAIKTDHMFIGQSKSREHMKLVLENYSNVSYDCGIFIFDMQQKISRFVHIPSIEVYGILIV